MALAITSPAHTPGPWTLDPGECVVYDVPVKLGVAKVLTFAGTAEEHLANGYLIAAAPQLLFACKELFSDRELFSSLSRVYGEERAGTLWALFKAAIDLAEGGE